MPPSRRYVLAGILVGVAVLTAVLMRGVLATVFFAITVAYVLLPVKEWVRRRGYSAWIASAVGTVVGFVALIFLFVPIVGLLYLRRRELIAAIRSLPDRVTITYGEFTYVVDATDVTGFAQSYVTDLAVGVARGTPVIAAKAFVFVFVVFALLMKRAETKRALLGPIPPAYRDIALAYNERFEEVLRALYVTQAVTGFATFLVALPVFWGLGYDFPVALAVVAGVLQFLPVIGPSVVVVALGLFEAVGGAYGRAAVVLVIGLVVIAFLPDAVLRPRLARRTARMPASLYFVGFTGGVLSLGFVGIIAGPLVVALLAESLSLLADEVNHRTIPGE